MLLGLLSFKNLFNTYKHNFMDTFISALQNRLTQPLPGIEAQWRMAHAVRSRNPLPKTKDARVACVLLALYPKNNSWHFVLIQRVSNNPQDRHGGQISFPGGGYEESDGTLEQGALREANEEVGILPDDVTMLGRMTDIFIPVSNFIVHPFIGYLNYTPDFIPQLSEVQEILEIPIADFKNPATQKKTEIKLPNNITLKNVPYFDLKDHVVWGATAMMLSEFLELID